MQAFLRAVRCPVLLLRAAQGWPIDAELAAARLACLAQLDRRVLPGCHHVHLVDPQPVADALLAFFGAETDALDAERDDAR